MLGNYYAENVGVLGYIGLIRFLSSTTFRGEYDGGDSAATRVGATTPFTFGSTDFFQCAGTYEAA